MHLNRNQIMKKIFVVFYLLLLSICLKAQLPISNIKLFTIINDKDTIQFVKLDADTTKTKPTILFCSGSLPIPLIIEIKEGVYNITSVSNFNYKKITEKYNLILMSKAYTPVVGDRKHLTNQYVYVPDTLKPHNFIRQFWETNSLEFQVERWNLVLNFLRHQSWVDKNKIIVCGHSQGSHEALQLAKQNPDIYALGYFSGNILGRYQSQIQQAREDANSGKISQEKAQKIIENKYQWWKTICRDTTEIPIEQSDSKKTWKSLSKLEIQDLTDIKTPVFIAYGTKDAGAQTADVMPVFFELAGKINYEMRPFLGCGHNFEEINLDGSSNWNKMHWDDAMSDFIAWIETLRE